jgi:hypothetical protein
LPKIACIAGLYFSNRHSRVGRVMDTFTSSTKLDHKSF